MLNYSQKLKDPRWQQRRLYLLQAANWRCQDASCRRHLPSLEIHHVYYETGREPWEYPDDAYLVLCEHCHEERQQKERALKIQIMRVLRMVPICRIESVAWYFLSQALKEAEVSA